ncbi:NahK/ErcS family hybrid sensor histidine kinase/response regulator [Pontibacter sp. JAM-7]|uniref:NahK/ErcS family hybrid sensor histidine kinase/response regulator n=1 Tax=Pontibacter sp. JAM-7 TaxID=3366581 RepID=UPI003AF6CA14
MLSGWSIILISLTYLGLLFAIAYYGDNRAQQHNRIISSPIIYSLSLAVYCSSWTFYGAVGRATTHGWEFLATYLGPVLVFIFGWHLLEKMILISKQQNITSIADFIASRYGKSQALAVLVTVIAVIGTLPYLALQLKAVAISFNALTPATDAALSKGSDTALFVALLMAVFAILFGTRHIDATEHHQGLVLAVAFESIIKLTAFIAVGLFAVFQVFDGVEDTLLEVSHQLSTNLQYSGMLQESFFTQSLLACAAIICLPRQFHVMIVENTNSSHLKVARWLFPLYLIVLAMFVLPIAVAGMQQLDGSGIDADTYVLMLPLSLGANELATFAFIGGLSASTSMVIVASIALAIMVCNDIIMPLLLRISWLHLNGNQDLGALLLKVRRITILGLMLLAYFYYRILGEQFPLASLGWLAFVATTQFLPAIIGGIYWKGGSRYGVFAGLAGGFALWLYTLVLPAFSEAGLIGPQFLGSGIFGIDWLQPTALFGLSGFDALAHGVFWSLSVNTALYILISRRSNLRLEDRMQASAFVDIYNNSLLETPQQYGQVTVGDLQLLTERFLGISRTQHSLTGFFLQRGEEPPLSGDKATPELVQFCERLLAGVIGSSSSRIVLASTLRGKDMQLGDVVSIVDEASEALRFNRSLLQSTIENISLGISVVDQQMRLVAWNRVYIDIFNYPDGLVCVGRPIEEVFRYNAIKGEYGPGSPDEQVRKRLQLLKSGKRHSYERFRPDGTVLEVRGNPLPNGGYVNTYMDITEHKDIAEALRESEQNIRIYTDNVPVLIAYLDPERRYLFVNRAYANAFGMERHQIIGKPCNQILPAEQYAYRSPFITAALEGKRQRFETKLFKPDGSMRYVEVTYIPHIGEYGDVLGYFTLYQDITERRQAELALQETNETLEQRVRERTHALSVVNKELRKENTIRSLMEDELRQAKGDADDANLGKTRFLAAASHDLLQPLNAARLFAAALAQQSHSGETQELVDNLDGSLKAAEELITALLDISKLDAGALEPNITDFCLSELLNGLSQDYKALAAKKFLNFRSVTSHQVIRSDQQLLRRVLQNFLSNSVRYTQHGRILLGCRLLKGQLRLEVWDTGVGIPENKLQEVFEEFRRIDNPKHSEVKGLGLGLAITERIARILKHKLNVRSWPGKGTVFSIEVPLGDPAKASKPKPEQRGWIRSKGLNGIHILVIDNETKILQGMSALLQGWSCEVSTAASMQAALNLPHTLAAPPDIILADYHLSETETGVMTLNALAKHWQHEIPAIVITADRTDEVKQEVEACGALLLTKPVKPAALRAMISKLLSQTRVTETG